MKGRKKKKKRRLHNKMGALNWDFSLLNQNKQNNFAKSFVLGSKHDDRSSGVEGNRPGLRLSRIFNRLTLISNSQQQQKHSWLDYIQCITRVFSLSLSSTDYHPSPPKNSSNNVSSIVVTTQETLGTFSFASRYSDIKESDRDMFSTIPAGTGEQGVPRSWSQTNWLS